MLWGTGVMASDETCRTELAEQRRSSAGVSRIGTTRRRTSRHATSSFEVVRRYEVSLAAIHSLEEAHVRSPKAPPLGRA